MLIFCWLLSLLMKIDAHLKSLWEIILDICKNTILNKTLRDFFTFWHSFLSPQVKRKQIIITIDLRLRILGNLEISRKS